MNTFRRGYRQLSEAEQEHIEQIKDAAQALEQAIHDGRTRTQGDPQHRMLALAITNLEQAVMWAVKAYT